MSIEQHHRASALIAGVFFFETLGSRNFFWSSLIDLFDYNVRPTIRMDLIFARTITYEASDVRDFFAGKFWMDWMDGLPCVF